MNTVKVEKVVTGPGLVEYMIITDHGYLWLSYTEMMDLASIIWRHSDPEEVAQILRLADSGPSES